VLAVFVLVNGRRVPESAAVIPVFDRGFLFGDAVFESMRAHAGTVFRLGQHLERLARSAALLGFEQVPDAASLAADVRDVLEANGLEDARVRLTLSRGMGRPGDYVGVEGSPTRVVSASRFSGLDPALYASGVRAAIAARRAVPPECLDPAVKTTSRIVSVLARREAQVRGAYEALFLDAAGHLTEGTASNLFLVASGTLRTPSSASGALPGVTRAAVLEAAAAAGLPIAEDAVPVSALETADELFLTNTSWEVLPVVEVDGRPIGAGVPGPVARDLLARYRALVRRECGGA
jgi:branched-chain amino acid aminotransferase